MTELLAAQLLGGQAAPAPPSDQVLLELALLRAANERLADAVRAIASEQHSNYQAYIGWAQQLAAQKAQV